MINLTKVVQNDTTVFLNSILTQILCLISCISFSSERTLVDCCAVVRAHICSCCSFDMYWYLFCYVGDLLEIHCSSTI